MIKSSRAFDANERVAEYRKSVAVVQENILLFKGYLGPTVKDKPELASVGERAARAAGVIVDSLGKLRCPPGTPNANQFTDMQMSNCLIPSAETAARDAGKLASRLIDGARSVLKSEKVRNAAKATAMIALTWYDTKYSDGMGSLTDSTLMSLAIFKSAGADALDFASESLHRRGKMSDERKKKLDAIGDSVKKSSDIDAKAFLSLTFKKRENKKKDPKVEPKSVKGFGGFKRGNRKIAKSKDNDSSVGSADVNGRNISRDLPTVKRDIDTQEKAADHLKNGKPLNEISDSLILDAVLDNLDVVGEDGKVEKIGRFELIRDGETSRIKDRSTGKVFSIKYSNDDFMDDRKTQVAAEGASDKFKNLLDRGMGGGKLHELDDEQLLKDHGLKRSSHKSVISDNPVYETDDVEQAIALLALGYEVEVPDDGGQKMVQNASKQMDTEIKKIAKERAAGLEALGSITPEEKAKWLKNFEETHDIDLCRLYAKKNMFCSENIGTQRANMPQSGGSTKGADSPAMQALIGGQIQGKFADTYDMAKKDRDRLKDIRKALKKPDPNNPVSEKDRNFAAQHEDTIGRYSDIAKILESGDPEKVAAVSQEDKDFVYANTNWSATEVTAERELIKFLTDVHPDGKNGIVIKAKDAKTLQASQNQLKSQQIDSSADAIWKPYMEARKSWGEPGTEEFVKAREEWLSKQWFQGAILTSSDGKVVDGHHRWAAIMVANDHLPEGEQIQVQVMEYQGSIQEALAVAKVFQEHLGIKGKTVGEDPFPYKPGTSTAMSTEEFSDHMKDLVENVREKIQDIKDSDIYPIKVNI